MTGYLLDTNIVSAFAPGKTPISPAMATWFTRQTDRLFLSAVSVIEIEAGIQKLRRAGATLRADDLRVWFGRILNLYGERILPLDITIGRSAGIMTDSARATGVNPGLADIAIAATADVRGLIVLTRNRKHFGPLGIAVLDPFEEPLPLELP